jgi:rhamnosyltransferase subunit B
MKVIVTTIGSLGDVHPCIALGLELKRRRHEVVIAISEFYRQKILSTGLGFHAIGPRHLSPEDPELLSSIMDPKDGPENFIRKPLMPHMRSVYDDLLAARSGAKFLITGELVFAASLVAERLGIRWASCVLAPWQFLALWQNSWVKERTTDEAAARKSTKAIVGPAARGNVASASGFPASLLLRGMNLVMRHEK